jgi:hypothetical protein
MLGGNVLHLVASRIFSPNPRQRLIIATSDMNTNGVKSEIVNL